MYILVSGLPQHSFNQLFKLFDYVDIARHRNTNIVRCLCHEYVTFG
jgi:hypothetical protein